jgi:hypothetical protein
MDHITRMEASDSTIKFFAQKGKDVQFAGRAKGTETHQNFNGNGSLLKPASRC